MRRTYLQRRDDLRLDGDRRTLEHPLEPVAERREAVELDAERVARTQDPRHVRDVGEAELGARQPRAVRELPVELRELAVERVGRSVLLAAQRVVRLREGVVPEDQHPRERTITRIGRQERRLGVPLLQVFEDHRGLGEQPRVFLEHRHASGRVLLVDPRGTVGQVDLGGLELDLLLGEHDPRAGAIRTAGGVVQREHQAFTPMSVAISSYCSWAGGRSAGDSAVRAISRTRCGSAPVRRATTVGFAPSAITSPGGSAPRYSGTDTYSSTLEPRSKRL